MIPETRKAENEAEEECQLVQLYYLDRDELWETVKPYNFHYFPKSEVPLHNLLRSPHTTRVRNLRPLAPLLALDLQGFELHHLRTRMKYQDFKDESLIENVYVPELENYFGKLLGAKRVRALDFQLRIREPNFPYSGGKQEINPQPSLMTHVDVTPESTRTIIHELYEDAATEICKSRYQIITIWRPLRLPVRDWPLAICDASTALPEDLVESDVIYPNYVAENFLVHFNENQKWYWLPDQAEDEVLVFKAVDSDPDKHNPCPHGAFPHPQASQDEPPRESIDVRLLVMYADIDYPQPRPWASSQPVI